MCLAVPVRVVEINGPVARVEAGGITKEANLQILGEKVKVGDYVLLHAGFAIQKVDEEEAQKTLELLREIGGWE